MNVILGVAGSIAVIVITAALAHLAARRRFARRAAVDRHELRHDLCGDADADQDIGDLPQPVQAWLRAAGVVARRRPSAVLIRYQGRFRPKPGAPWLPLEADHLAVLDRPGFSWHGRVRIAPGVWLNALDRYRPGAGSVHVALPPLTIARSEGPLAASSSLGRYLAEMVLFPEAAVASWLRWETVDSRHARAQADTGTESASALYTFSDNGLVKSVNVMRYYGVGPSATLEEFVGYAGAATTVDNVTIPGGMTGGWRLKGGTFTFFAITRVRRRQVILSARL